MMVDMADSFQSLKLLQSSICNGFESKKENGTPHTSTAQLPKWSLVASESFPQNRKGIRIFKLRFLEKHYGSKT